MRKRRSETFAERFGAKTVAEVLAENTYGGTKTGERRSSQMPVVAAEEGVKLEWDRCSEEYPSIVKLQMTDGQWVTYRIEIEQPGFTAAMDIIRNPAHMRGYPPKRS